MVKKAMGDSWPVFKGGVPCILIKPDDFTCRLSFLVAKLILGRAERLCQKDVPFGSQIVISSPPKLGFRRIRRVSLCNGRVYYQLCHA
jgi:hypothetical protein